MTNEKTVIHGVKKPGESDITLAVFEFQCRFKGVDKVRVNTFTNSTYAALDDIMHVANPILEQLKIAVIYTSTLMPLPDGSAFVPVLTCKLLHIPSGTVLESSLPLPEVTDGAQLIGGYMTYWRRYLFCGMVNIVETSDDDGNATIVPTIPNLTEKQHSEILDFVEATGTTIGDADTEGTLLYHINAAMSLTAIEQLSSRQATTILKMLKAKYKRQTGEK